MNRFKQLQKQRAEALAKANALLADKPDATAEQTAADTAAANTLLEEIKGIDAQLAPLLALQEAERNAPVLTGGAIAVTDRAAADPMRGFRSAADFANSVMVACRAGGRVDPRLLGVTGGETQIGAAPTNFHNEGHSQDGYMVPPAVRDEIRTLIFEADDILAAVQPEPTESNSVQWLSDETTPWGSTGIQAAWRSEGSQMTPSRLATQPNQLQLHELYAFVTATDELLADAPRLNARITSGAARAITWKASEAIVRGTGSGQPMGWENSPALISVAKETSQAAATILPKNLVKMYSRLLRGPGSRPTWYANSDIVPELVDLRIGNEPSWTARDGGLKSAPEGMLLGIPVKFTEHAKTLGTTGDIQLVNLAGYYAAIKSGGVKFDSSIHLFFDYGLTAFRWTFRLAGQPYLSAAVSPAQGSVTKSDFVYLDTRA